MATRKKKAEGQAGRHFRITRKFFDGTRLYQRNEVITLPAGIPENPVTEPREYWIACDATGRALADIPEKEPPKDPGKGPAKPVAMSSIQRGSTSRPPGA